MSENEKEKEQEKKSIFREKSMERMSAPENLNDYIRVSNPSVWVIMAAVIVLLVGVLVWGVFGQITMNNTEGNQTTVNPISFVIN